MKFGPAEIKLTDDFTKAAETFKTMLNIVADVICISPQERQGLD
jgi:hypothetical protein